MNPFFMNSSFILDQADAMFRAHDRMFNMIHERMREEAMHARRETDIYRAPLAPGQVLGRPSGRMRDGFYNNMPNNFNPRARSSGRPFQRSSFSKVPSPSNNIRRFDTLAREGIQPQLTNGDSSVSPSLPKRRSSAAAQSSRRSVDHSTSSSSDKSSNNNKSRPPLKYTRLHGLGWYQISDADSGNVTIRGNNLSCAANSSMNFMIVHYPSKALSSMQNDGGVYSTELRCQAKWEQSLALLHIVLGFQDSEHYHLLSIDENEHRTELRRCAGAPGTLRLSSASTVLGTQSYSSTLPTTSTKDEDTINDGNSSIIDGNSSRFMSILLKVDDGKVTLLINGEIAFATAAALFPRSSVNGQANAIFGIFCMRSNRVQVKDWRVTVTPTDAAADVADLPSKANSGNKAGGKTLASFYNAPAATTSSQQQAPRSSKQQQQAQLQQLLPQPLLQGEVSDRIKALPFEPELVNGILADIVPAGSITIIFNDIAALTGPKRILSEAVLLPLLMPELFVGLREPWRGILLFGPPGTGKTMLAKAVAGQHRGTFFSCAASTLISKWRGDSEKLVKCLFAAARVASPSVVFLDEVDALVSSRGGSGEHESSRRMKTEFFSQMDGLTSSSSSSSGGQQQQVMVLATTNCPWDLDAAVLRRFEKRIYVPLPDREARYEHFKLCLRDLQQCSEDEGASDHLDAVAMELAERSEGYSSADIVQVCREAAMAPMRRLLAQHSMDALKSMRNRGNLSADVAQVQKEDYEAALRQTKPSVPAQTIARYEQWNEMYGSGTDLA